VLIVADDIANDVLSSGDERIKTSERLQE